MDNDYLTEVAQQVDAMLPDNHGFILFTFPFGDQGTGRINYISNGTRSSCIEAIKEWLYHQGKLENWMKHLDDNGEPL